MTKFTTFNPADWLRTEEAREYFLQDAEATGEPEYIEQAKIVVEKSREVFPISLLLEEGSKATHTTIQEYYSTINKAEPKPEITASKPKWFETSGKYAERLEQEIVQQINPKFKELSSKAAKTEIAQKEAKEAKATVADYKDRYQPIIDALQPLEHSERQRLVDAMKAESAKIQAEKERQKQEEIEAKKARIADRKRQRSFSDLAKKKPKGLGW